MTDPTAGTALSPKRRGNLCPLPQCGGDTAENPGPGRCLCWRGLGTMRDVDCCLSAASVPICRGALKSHVGPRRHGESLPYRAQGVEAVPEEPVERFPCRGETLTTKRLQEMLDTGKPPQEMPDTDELPTVVLPVVPSRVPSPETRKDPSGVNLPPWLGKWGTSPEKGSPIAVPLLPPTPPTPAEKPSQSVPQRSRVTHDWQKEVTLKVGPIVPQILIL